MLIEHQKPPPQYETPPPPAPPTTSQSDTAETDSTSSSESTGCLHVWKEKEEDMLVHLRHERQDLFLKTRNHSTLWQEISEELCKTFKTKISSTQALNKYNNLKKKWKEIIDAGTGTERKDFRLKEEFDLAFGTKPSAKPLLTLDSTTNISTDGPSSPTSLGSPSGSLRNSRPGGTKKLPKKGNCRRHRNCWKIFQTQKKNLIPKSKSFIGRKWKEWIDFWTYLKKVSKRDKCTQ